MLSILLSISAKTAKESRLKVSILMTCISGCVYARGDGAEKGIGLGEQHCLQ